MTREEVRKEVDKLIDSCYTKGSPSYPELSVFLPQKFLNKLFPLLDKLGVVKKVDRELPLNVIEKDLIDLELRKTSRQWVLQNLDYQVKKAGYVAVESLIKE